jgi:hypothetical protein
MALAQGEVLVTDAADPINVVLAKIADGSVGIVQASDQILVTLRQMGLAYRMKIHCRQVGFDPSNRDETGGNSAEVHLLGSDIVYVGWSWQQCAHAQAVEAIPGDNAVEIFNRKLSEGAASPLSPVEADTIRFGSITCGHTNQVLRCVDASVASACPLLAESGQMSKEHIRRRDPEFAKAVDEGLMWEVFKWPVRVRYPKVLGVLQGAGNVAGHVQRKVHEVSGLCQMHQMWAASQAEGKEANWCHIKRAILRSRPPFAEDLDCFIAFLSSKSGGVKGDFLKFLAAYHNQFVTASLRTMPGQVFSALADFPHVYLAHALLATGYLCPKEKVEYKTCRWVKPGDIAALAKSDPVRLRAADNILAVARDTLQASQPGKKIWESNVSVAVLTKLDSNMGRFLL